MKRYRSRLESVLKVRRIHEDVARSELARANLALNRAEDAALRASAHYREVRASSPTSAPVPDALAARQQVGLAARAIHVASRRVSSASDEADAARAGYKLAAARVTVLEELEQRRRAEHAAAAAREEIAMIDELVTARFIREAAR